MKKFLLVLALLAVARPVAAQKQDKPQKPRAIVSTDIGGGDPDDFQSMVHYLVYADRFDTEGLISSPPKAGRKAHILEVIAAYEKDYPKLKRHSPDFPAPDALRAVTKQGALDPQKGERPKDLSEGARHLIKAAKKDDPRPLYVLVWGSITDVAQALRAEPEIKNKIRVYFISSWNRRQDYKARDYIYNEHLDLWWIENDMTFRGMYMGGAEEDDLSNAEFVKQHVKSHGALGELYWAKKQDIKMGDTPSVLYLLDGDPHDPAGESWGGAFVQPDPERRPHYWSDNLDSVLVERGKHGARTVNKWREAYLRDWQRRMEWLR